MIIPELIYNSTDSNVPCSMVCSLATILEFYNYPINKDELNNLFGTTFLSSAFQRWNLSATSVNKFEVGEMTACAQYILTNIMSDMSADIVKTELSKINLSFIKRGIPVILTGNFPFLRGNISNSILVKGYVDKYFIVNDPRGNAYTGYIDKYGENVLYSIEDIETWVAKGKAHVLRIIPKKGSIY